MGGSSVGWALEDKECGIRVCSNLATNERDHVECKLVDASCNLYLGLAALVHSGLEGILGQYSLRPSLSASQETAAVPLPATLEESLDALEHDEGLTKDLLGPRLTQAYLALRRNEAQRSSTMKLQDEVREAL